MSKKTIAHKPHEKWGDDKKIECAIAVMAHGSIEKAAKQCNISPKTLGHWSRHDDGFNEALEKLQGEKSLEALSTYGLIVDKAQRITLEKLDDATAAQANIIAATATDKSLLLQGKATSISGRSETMASLQAQFEKLASTHSLVPKSKIIDQG